MTRKRAIITIISAALLASAAISAAAIRGDRENENQKQPIAGLVAAPSEENHAYVTSELLKGSTLTEYVTATGTAEAAMDVTFSAEIPGRLEYLGPKLGGRVRKGSLLAKVDYRTLRAQKMQATATYELASKTYERLRELGRDLVTQQQLDEAESALKGATATLAIANSALEKSRVTSSIRGVVSAKYVDEAEYVGPGTPLYRVVDHSTIIIEANLPETQVSSVKQGARVSVEIKALGEIREGIVDAVLPAAHNESKTFTARIEVKNPDLRILQGMSAMVKIAARVHQDTVVVPQDLVLESTEGKSVFVIENGKAIKRSVSLGGVEGDRVAILEGVLPGETIITMGHRDLTHGDAVKISEQQDLQ